MTLESAIPGILTHVVTAAIWYWIGYRRGKEAR